MLHANPVGAASRHQRASPTRSGGEYYATTTDSAADDDDNDDGENDDDDKEDAGFRGRRPARKRAKSRASSVSSATSHSHHQQPQRRPSVTSPASSTSEGVTTHKRRPTYLLQKDERDELVDQVRLMEARLELLRLRAGLLTLQDSKSVASLEAEKLDIEESIHENLLSLAQLHSLVTHQIHTMPVFPLSSHISLPVDHAERRAVMESVKELKLRRAAEINLDRLTVMDPLKPYLHEERRSTPDGLHHWFSIELQQFEGLRSVKQLYDVMLYLQNNLEISVSEMLGQLTLREDTEDDDPTLFNQRIVTTGEIGGAEELNSVGFACFHEAYAPLNGTPVGVIAIDTVEDDELYPYKPLERTRKDLQVAYTLTEHRRPGTNELVVVLMSTVYMAQLPPQFPLPAAVWDKLLENMPRWMRVTRAYLKNAVAAIAASEHGASS